jgi:aconitase A
MTAPPFYSKTLDFSLSYIIYSIALPFTPKLLIFRYLT